MKTILLLLSIALPLIYTKAQDVIKLDDFGRIALNTYVSDQVKLPAEAKAQLETKLKQIATNYGMAGTVANPRFVLTANIAVSTKDIIPGPPQQIAQNLEITLFIGDAIENKVFSNSVISASGVGTNENKAFIDAIKKVNPKNQKIESFLEEGKTKIIAYYATQCDFISQKAATLKQQEQFGEAMYVLAQVPDVCKDCYVKSLQEMAVIYDLKINTEGTKLLNEAKAIWAAKPNAEGAEQAIRLLMKINSRAKSSAEAPQLLKTMNDKVIADEKERLRKQEEYEKRQQEIAAEKAKTEAELEKQRINAYREVAVEYAKNQPQVIYRNVYRNIYWY